MIKNLTRQLNEAGKIKIGKKGTMITSAKGTEFRPPKKLDHFQLVTTEKDQNGDYIVDVDLQNKIKESKTGLTNQAGCLVGLPIRLLYDDTELNFPHQYLSYVSGKRSCTGNGEVSFKRVDNFTKDHPCPCGRIEPGYDGKDKCKPTGTLTCVIDEAGLFGQAHKFRTTSLNTIKGILGGIELIKQATNGKIAGLPLMLTMNAKQTTTPQGIATTVYVVSICYRGGMADLRKEALALMAMEKQYLISMDQMEAEARESGVISLVAKDAEEEKDFVEEFFPNAVVVADDDKGDQTAAESTKPVEPDVSADEPVTPPGDDSENLSETELDIKMLEPAGSYKTIYKQFIAERDLEKAMAFAKRLQKGNLFYWLVNTYPDIEFDPGIKKPETLDLIYNVLESVLKKTASKPEAEATREAGRNTEETKEEEPPEAEVYPRKKDKSGPITKPQLRTLVQLKATLEGQGTLQPDKWFDHVAYFLDEDGRPIKKATDLTTKQGETFIAMLTNAVKKDKVLAA